ncbi:MAG: tetratricopeptide repeat protein, partial [Lewinella sp.]|nr:tetratricopeptide repeat protein [Lewinella sp.]
MRARLFIFWLFYGGMLTAQPEFTLKSGEQLSHLNQYGQSTEQLEAFIKENPSRLYDQSEALLLISYNHMQLGDYANALATNDASLRIKAQLQADDLVKNYVRYGAVHLLRGNYSLALSYLMRAKDLPIEDIPLYAVIDGHLAAAYRGLGQFAEAAAYYRQSIETLLIEYPEDHPE